MTGRRSGGKEGDQTIVVARVPHAQKHQIGACGAPGLSIHRHAQIGSLAGEIPPGARLLGD